MAHEFPLVYIEWVDSRAIGRGWTLTDEIKSTPMICHSIGWLYQEFEESIMIVPHFAEDPEQCNGGLEIPKCSIRKTVGVQLIPEKRKTSKKK